jgi:prepilin-type N-terminal cleavage/methylation domain-containing protein
MRYPTCATVRPCPPARGRGLARRGFTLIEAAMVTVIIGVGVVSMLQLLAAGTLSNSEGTELTTAINLANNVREFSLGLDYYDPQTDKTVNPPNYQWNTKESTVKLYDNIMDLDGSTDTWNQTGDPASGYQKFSPPLDVRRDPINTYLGWEQWVKVETVSPNSVATVLPHDASSPTARVTVKIVRNGTEVYRMTWLAVAPK